MKDALQRKIDSFIATVTGDSRWSLQDELLVQVVGFTLYGYASGVGRLLCFLDVEEIEQTTRTKLIQLGVGPEYARGLIQAISAQFPSENLEPVEVQLAGVGHSHFADENPQQLVELVFVNADRLRQSA